MFPESSQPGAEGDHNPPPATGRSAAALDREVRDLVNSITHRIANLHGPGHHDQAGEEDDQHGVRIVTLAGTNMGATMRSELPGDRSSSSAPANKGLHAPMTRWVIDEDAHDDDDDDDSEAGTFVNSNFQAVNNSIMMSSGYNTNDPGVHLDISDVFGPPRPRHHHHQGLGMDKPPATRKQLWKIRKDKATESLYSASRSD